jgi:hypothetical protein
MFDKGISLRRGGKGTGKQGNCRDNGAQTPLRLAASLFDK